MFEALVIALREGVEAALVLGIARGLLARRGRADLEPALWGGAALAVAASVVAAVLAARLTYNQEAAEGLAMLVGAALVVGLVVWMWRSGPHLKAEIEAGMTRAAAAPGTGRPAVFLFAFGMVFREGVETAIFLGAASFNSAGVARAVGAGIGLALAIGFGVLFARGTFRIALRPFFSLTSAVLLLVAFQLLVGGLHELSEAEWLPSSRAEMALVGPLVKNELLLFTLTVALAAAWLLFAPRGATAAAATSGPEARLDRARRAGERSWRRWTGTLALGVVVLLSTAFAQSTRLPGRPPATPLPIANGIATLPLAALGDGHIHFYEAVVRDPATGLERAVRFFALRAGAPGAAGSGADTALTTCLDACTICGDKGYFESGGAVVCRNCTSPIAITTLGRGGGCNPIPLPHRVAGDHAEVREADLVARLARLKGR